MSDEEGAALVQRLDWCEAQLGLVRKRMFSMGILIALLTVALIWRTKAPTDLVRTGDAARFTSVALVDEAGRRAFMDAERLVFTGPEEHHKTVVEAPSDGGFALSVIRPGASTVLRPAEVRLSSAKGGSIEIGPTQMIMLGPKSDFGQTDIGPGFVGTTGAGGQVVLDGRKAGYGVRLNAAGGKTEHLQPR